MYQTEYGFQGVDGIMADFGIQSFSDFANETEIIEYFTIANINTMFGQSYNDGEGLSQTELDEIRDEFIVEWEEATN